MAQQLINDLMQFMDSSVCNFLAVDTVKHRLLEAGFIELDTTQPWELTHGGKYFITKNDSAIFAWIVGEGDPSCGVKIISSHCDSPCFRIKPSAEIFCEGGVVKLNTEVYGGPILYTWFDRPLSLAGRVMLRGDDALNPTSEIVKFDTPLLTIPHLAIHFNRQVNEGNKLSKQKDMLPVVSLNTDAKDAKYLISDLISNELGVSAEDILDYDLMLYDTTPAQLVGIDGEMFTSGRIDDLSMVHASMSALLDSQQGDMTCVMAVFDNEETGSGTKQGAASPVLHNLLRRINIAMGGDEESFLRSIDASFMVSADNAHALHPNYPEKHDPTNHPTLGGGPVIKINANCEYMTDAQSAAVFRSICEQAGVPCQTFVNHSDSPGGSTLGNILTSQIDLKGVDMGAAIWAMHSCRETSSTIDHEYIVKAFTQFYNL